MVETKDIVYTLILLYFDTHLQLLKNMFVKPGFVPPSNSVENPILHHTMDKRASHNHTLILREQYPFYRIDLRIIDRLI